MTAARIPSRLGCSINCREKRGARVGSRALEGGGLEARKATHLAGDERERRCPNPPLDDSRAVVGELSSLRLLDRHAREAGRAGGEEDGDEERVDLALALRLVGLRHCPAERPPSLLEVGEGDRRRVRRGVDLEGRPQLVVRGKKGEDLAQVRTLAEQRGREGEG